MINESVKEELYGRSVDELLDSLSLELMRDNIYQQIYDELKSSRNFLEIVLNKFRFIAENGDFDDDTKQTIHSEITDFCAKIIDYIVSKFELAYNENPGHEQDIAELLYQFFVLKRVDNTRKFIIRYIEENKADIVDGLQLEKGADVMSIAAAQKISDPYDIKIVSNVDAVIKYIISMDVSTEDFLTILCADGEFYAQEMLDYYYDDTIDGHFVTEYISEIVNDYDGEYATGIRNDIQIHFGLR